MLSYYVKFGFIINYNIELYAFCELLFELHLLAFIMLLISFFNI